MPGTTMRSKSSSRASKSSPSSGIAGAIAPVTSPGRTCDITGKSRVRSK